MDLIYAQLTGFISVFLVLALCSILPFILVKFCFEKRRKSNLHNRDDEHYNNRRQNSVRLKICILRVLELPWFSLLNCFATGIFMATCFIGLVPHVRNHVTIYQDSLMHQQNGLNNKSVGPHGADGHAHKSGRVPWTEFLLVMGFLCILVFEELGRILRALCCTTQKKQNSFKNTAKVVKVPQQVMGNGGGLDNLENKFEVTPILNEDQPLMDITNLENDGLIDVYKPNTKHMKNNSDGSHHHHHASMLLVENGSITWRSIALLMSLGVHGLFEGVALGLQDTTEAFFRLLIGVMTHEILCAIAFGINLAGSGVRTTFALFLSTMLAATVPGGMIAGLTFRKSQSDKEGDGGSLLIQIILEGFAAGTFVYVAFFDMLNRELLLIDKYRLLKIMFVVCGFLTFFVFTLS